MEKTCPKCNATFSCKNEMPGCWCNDVNLSSYTLNYLKKNFENCLCPDCLKPFEIVDLNAEVEMEEDEYE